MQCIGLSGGYSGRTRPPQAPNRRLFHSNFATELKIGKILFLIQTIRNTLHLVKEEQTTQKCDSVVFGELFDILKHLKTLKNRCSKKTQSFYLQSLCFHFHRGKLLEIKQDKPCRTFPPSLKGFFGFLKPRVSPQNGFIWGKVPWFHSPHIHPIHLGLFRTQRLIFWGKIFRFRTLTPHQSTGHRSMKK